MEWKEVPSEKKWVLHDNGDIAAVIISIDKDNITNKYQTKTLISAIYLGKKRFARLEKKHNDWFSTKRKFATPEAREIYIKDKKKEILKYINIRFS